MSQGLQTNQCCCESSVSSFSSFSSSSIYCPASTFEREVDMTACTDQEIADMIAGVPQGGSGWDLRFVVQEEGPGRVPITLYLYWACCDGKPTGPGGPSSGTDACDDLFIDNLVGDWLADNPCNGGASITFFFASTCIGTNRGEDIVDVNEPGQTINVHTHNGCLNCCGQEVFDEVVV